MRLCSPSHAQSPVSAMWLERLVFRRSLVILVFCLLQSACAQRNITLTSTDSDIIYSPPACNETVQTDSCSSPWRIIPSPDGPSCAITTTDGPTDGGLLPQLFMRFTAIALYIRTSSLSNATANITLFTDDPTLSITTTVDTAAGLIVAVGLQPNKATTLVITFIPSDAATRLDISSFMISMPSNDTTPFPSTILPTSTLLPTFSTPRPSSTATSSSRTSQTTGDIVAEVLGAALGVALGASGAFAYRYCRNRRRRAHNTSPPS